MIESTAGLFAAADRKDLAASLSIPAGSNESLSWKMII